MMDAQEFNNLKREVEELKRMIPNLLDIDARRRVNGGTLFGTFSDTATVIAASSTYTKTIPLGFNALKGNLFIRGGTMGRGGWVRFDATANNAIGFGYYDGSIRQKSIDGYCFPAELETTGGNIRLDDAYISGTDLILKFRNVNATTPKTLNIPHLRWEVE